MKPEEEALQNANNCPFCGTNKKHLDISRKSTGPKRGDEPSGHICVYCRICRTYGPRVLEYSLPDATNKGYYARHWFKTLQDLRRNSDNHPWRPIFVKVDDSEISHDWYLEEAVRLWNERLK